MSRDRCYPLDYIPLLPRLTFSYIADAVIDVYRSSLLVVVNTAEYR